MSHYPITWITDNLAVGHAPMSYDELDSIKEQGITGIVNLCGEFCDLHEIEEHAGFEVFYIPIPDETAPTIEEMEKGLEWLDEAVYLGKKVLIHCKHGVGRTGTFITAYMLRRGFNLRKAEKLLKKTRANPTNYSQWWLLRKFGKQEGQLKIREATPENRRSSNLERFYDRYEQLLAKVDTAIKNNSQPDKIGNNSCCKNFSLQPIEALYLNNSVNIGLTAEQRNQVIEKAVELEGNQLEGITKTENKKNLCPLFQDARCLLYKYRPLACRIHEEPLDEQQMAEINRELEQLSREIFQAIFGQTTTLPPLAKRAEALSGKFIQKYFQYLASHR